MAHDRKTMFSSRREGLSPTLSIPLRADLLAEIRHVGKSSDGHKEQEGQAHEDRVVREDLACVGPEGARGGGRRKERRETRNQKV